MIVATAVIISLISTAAIHAVGGLLIAIVLETIIEVAVILGTLVTIVVAIVIVMMIAIVVVHHVVIVVVIMRGCSNAPIVATCGFTW